MASGSSAPWDGPGLWDHYREGTIQERFERWMLTPDGLEVYRYVLERAQALRERGWDHYGMSPLWEMARYDGSLRVGPEGGFKLNDHYKSRLARRMMAEHADLEGFFELRELRA